MTIAEPAAALGREIVAHIDELAAISAEPGVITRVFLTPEHRAAADLLMGWMRDAGMSAAIDAIGNVVGRYEGEQDGLPCLMLGSHYDTVRNAGRWDGPLGVITAIACVGALHRRGRRLPFAIEVVGFADEEGVRFASTLLGSRAVAGTFDARALDSIDRDGITMREALRAFGLDPGAIATAAHAPGAVLGYVELHIEQGPVLEAEGLPVGVVSAISGATRLSVTLTGMAGHAGTVPMALRRDALTGAAECILAIETYCRGHAGLVGTVGQIAAEPGATNVIPGRVGFTMDIRTAGDDRRKAAVGDLTAAIEAAARRRGLEVAITVTHENRTVNCAGWLKAQVAAAVAAEGYAVRELPSGAGHDAMAIADIADMAMIFVRCRGGISHHPDEHAELGDVEAGAKVLLRLIETFSPRDNAR
ncbi:allantoate amidohydrolase [Bradyrhizobium sp. WD16]|uniref:allantoate amidohydrolase n=1 Tax=Bradyrhizobium sp. WD16 TaxID=1521768 RepID=UPI0020A44B5F|nr:allantoate amidohydrolase [Bradyrhizobium sp. WD16]UTD27858.1 allantoate amidohydrolase [Bradyrhizobium sp. WD16]